MSLLPTTAPGPHASRALRPLLLVLALLGCSAEVANEEAEEFESTSGGLTFGETSPGSAWELLGQDSKSVSQFTLTGRATVTGLTVYVAGAGKSGNQSLRGVVYADEGGRPGALVATTAEVKVSGKRKAGWIGLSLPAPTEIPAGTYWLGNLAGPKNQLVKRAYSSGANGSAFWNPDTYADGASAHFGAGNAYGNRISIYATYTAAPVEPAPACGDGVVDAGEQCDLGAANGDAGACCSATCTSQDCGPAPTAWIPERGQYAIGSSAWSSSSIDTESLRHDWAIFHAPQANITGQRDAYLAADPTSRALVYQNWSMGCVHATWTTCPFSADEARRLGFVAKFGGQEFSGWPDLVNLDAGKPGYGEAWVTRALARVDATGPWQGVFLDDLNITYNGAPGTGIPDGYASVTAYRDAVKAQLLIALERLRTAGYLTQVNLSGITEWNLSRYGVNDDLVGLADYTMLEFCGTWGQGQGQWDPNDAAHSVQTRLFKAGQTAAARGKKLLCLGHTTDASDTQRVTFNDILTRIATEPGYGAGSVAIGNDYNGPYPWTDAFRADYGLPTGAVQSSGPHFWRSFSSGRTLHVDFQTLTGWVTTP